MALMRSCLYVRAEKDSILLLLSAHAIWRLMLCQGGRQLYNASVSLVHVDKPVVENDSDAAFLYAVRRKPVKNS